MIETDEKRNDKREKNMENIKKIDVKKSEKKDIFEKT